MTTEVLALEYLREVGRDLKTQDNRITADPVFIVQQKRRDYGYDLEYCDAYEWRCVDDPERELDEDEIQRLESGTYVDDGAVEKVGYCDRWEFVTAAFTEKACQRYIDRNRHNLNEPRIYAASGYRNEEWIQIRAVLMALAEKKP